MVNTNGSTTKYLNKLSTLGIRARNAMASSEVIDDDSFVNLKLRDIMNTPNLGLSSFLEICLAAHRVHARWKQAKTRWGEVFYAMKRREGYANQTYEQLVKAYGQKFLKSIPLPVTIDKEADKVHYYGNRTHPRTIWDMDKAVELMMDIGEDDDAPDEDLQRYEMVISFLVERYARAMISNHHPIRQLISDIADYG